MAGYSFSKPATKIPTVYKNYPWGKKNKIMPNQKDTGGVPQRPILPSFKKKVAGTTSREINRGHKKGVKK